MAKGLKVKIVDINGVEHEYSDAFWMEVNEESIRIDYEDKTVELRADEASEISITINR